MISTPPSLLERLRGPHDQAAWSRFAELYTPFVYNILRKAGLNEHDTAESVQEVFIRLLKVMPVFQYNPESRFRGFLCTMTLNTWRSLRKQWHRRVLNGPGEVEDIAEDLQLPEITEVEYRQYLICQAMRIVKRDFEEKTWQAVWQSVVEGRDPAVVATDLGMTVAAVYAAKARVIKRLRSELEGLLD